VATNFGVNLNLNINIDVNKAASKIFKDVSKAIAEHRDREVIIQIVCRNAEHYFGDGHYVMVCNLRSDPVEQLKGKIFWASFRLDNEYFGVWVFKSGEFYNRGDGGYGNWRFTNIKGCTFRYKMKNGQRHYHGSGMHVQFDPI
jgi:hypothetical protein